MLILTRKVGQAIIIGEGIEIKILEIVDGQIKLGITAPKNISVLRKELVEIKDENLKAASVNKEALSKIENFIKKR
ncbi:MAG: Carbon storage regulator, CsrA [Caldanaerobacter subterraneus]|jgi:carbon storage regulator|uniref:Translational regulator CsrA n=3 Tax=Thermoanaerobacter TaxID=1754 RepID=B0KC63_THEP3|nr:MULTISPECIES: carbon storage regulator CsrA [Thermoanaerobacter]KUK35277.1 MAG: Carbon storage regulator, CsrA [Caldanaerobacter subterraneus]ABY91765.1 carbon storage regulator, CsrA [Thermoanaerobacter sp. X514]ABY95417.1 carbon storage regulator, CsrA [Thermoanaerobacter pseudethanolicus ATCC 33223]ADV80360.1 carbon storage regulator [Thermoanaerobacter brockii subsp. finnii Ako-1]EMT39036.1 carbon storage regulator (csrA) [Thermoanaerobacter thermohydrosulfuricus WC1]